MGFPCENSETEFSIMTDIKQHEYDLLNEIGHDPLATQANLSTRGNDEALDILPLTCIEAGIRLSETSNGVTMKVVGQDYQMSMED